MKNPSSRRMKNPTTVVTRKNCLKPQTSATNIYGCCHRRRDITKLNDQPASIVQLLVSLEVHHNIYLILDTVIHHQNRKMFQSAKSKAEKLLYCMLFVASNSPPHSNHIIILAQLLLQCYFRQVRMHLIGTYTQHSCGRFMIMMMIEAASCRPVPSSISSFSSCCHYYHHHYHLRAPFRHWWW